MGNYSDPDAFYEARLAPPVGEARRQMAVILGAQPPVSGVGEKSIGDQVLAAKVDGSNGVGQVLLDISNRTAVLIGRSKPATVRASGVRVWAGMQAKKAWNAAAAAAFAYVAALVTTSGLQALTQQTLGWWLTGAGLVFGAFVQVYNAPNADPPADILADVNPDGSQG